MDNESAATPTKKPFARPAVKPSLHITFHVAMADDEMRLECKVR